MPGVYSLLLSRQERDHAHLAVSLFPPFVLPAALPDASAEVMEEADELFREYETLVHSMDREFEKKVSQELGRQVASCSLLFFAF